MSVGATGGVAGSVAGSPLAQTQGSEVERARQDAGAQQRRVESDQKADSAAGIGEANGEDHEPAERDADGRRLWEPESEKDINEEADADAAPPHERQSKDATGQSGNLLDLSG